MSGDVVRVVRGRVTGELWMMRLNLGAIEALGLERLGVCQIGDFLRYCYVRYLFIVFGVDAVTAVYYVDVVGHSAYEKSSLSLGLVVVLGADIGQMADLAKRISSTSGAIGKCQASTGRATNRVVSQVTAEARTALKQIQGEMTELRASVSGSVSQANATQWTGVNANTFRSSAVEFDGAMQRAEAATAEAFQTFEASIQKMADALEQYQQSFNGAMSKAQASSNSMQQAVVSQKMKLDDTMNTGMTRA